MAERKIPPSLPLAFSLLAFSLPAWAGFVCPPNSAPVCCNSPEDPGCGPRPVRPTRPPYEVSGSGQGWVETDNCRSSERAQAIAEARYQAMLQAKTQCPGGQLVPVGDWQEDAQCSYGLNGSRYGAWAGSASGKFECWGVAL